MNTPDRSGWSQRTQRGIAGVGEGRLRDEERDPARIDRLAVGERVALRDRARAPAAGPRISGAELALDDQLRSGPRGSARLPPARRASAGAGKAARTCSSKKWANGPWPTSWSRPGDPERLDDEALATGTRLAGARRSVARSDGYSERAHSPASCMTPRPWVKRECSAVGKTQRALWSWLIRRRRWSQAVSRRSSSATVLGRQPGGRRLVAAIRRFVSST